MKAIIALSVAAVTVASVAVYELADRVNVTSQVCVRLNRLVDLDADRIVRARDATIHQDYYRQHPDELVRYVQRARRNLEDLKGARC